MHPVGMARKLRMVVPGLPVHIVQRGVNRCDIFANDKDHNIYLQFLIEASDKHACPVHCYADQREQLVPLMDQNEDSGWASPEIKQAWLEECDRRVQLVKEGKAGWVGGEQFMRDLRESLAE
jgi:hypothetical protein